MNFLKIKTCWSTLELGLLKICLLSSGMLITLCFYEYIKMYYLCITGVFIVTTIIGVGLWIKKIKAGLKAS